LIREALIVAVAALAAGCAPRPRMCTQTGECAAQSACVAGRCQPSSATVKPAVDTAKRVVVRPVDLAYVRPGDGPSDGALPPIVTLGKDGATLLLRFSVALPEATNVVEAYLVLRRAGVVDDDPSPISLHVTRIVEPWQGRSTSWALQPRLEETRSPLTLVEPGGPTLVRLDVRELVRRWPRRHPSDQGIAVVPDLTNRTGTTFALTAVAEPLRSGTDLGFGPEGAPGSAARLIGQDRPRSVAAADVEPYLELYLR
jgi:hypothetical protein